MTSPPSLAVIVVNYNSGPYLRRALASLAAQSCSPDRVIVIDNGSVDDSLTACETIYPGVEIHRLDRNLGFAEGNNIAASLVADCEWIALLNPDAFAVPDWVERMVEASRRSPSFDVFACRLVEDGDPSILDGAGDAYNPNGIAWPRYKGARVGVDGDADHEVFGACGAAALYRRSAFEDAGRFDESYFCYHEDVDLAFRLRLRGYRCLYIPSAVVRHVGSAISGWGSDFSVYYSQRNMVWTYVKNMPGWYFWLYLPSHIVVNLITILVFLRKGQGRLILRAKWHALRGLPVVLSQRKKIQRRRTVSAARVLTTMSRSSTMYALMKNFSRSWRRKAVIR